MTTISVRFFGSLSESIGPAVTLDFEGDVTVGTLRSRLSEIHADAAEALATCMIAVNTEFSADDAVLTADDEVALLPPVSGG